jgi:hypothetical protein
MDEICRILGRERERELLRDAERLHRGAHARAVRRAQRGHGLERRTALSTTRESLRRMRRRIGATLRPAQG